MFYMCYKEPSLITIIRKQYKEKQHENGISMLVFQPR